jgi:hypothetical protein
MADAQDLKNCKHAFFAIYRLRSKLHAYPIFIGCNAVFALSAWWSFPDPTLAQELAQNAFGCR